MTSRATTLTRNFIDSRSLVFWAFVGLAVNGAIHIFPLTFGGVTIYPGPGLLALIVWSLYGILFAVILYKLELFERRSPITIIGAFVWGAVVVHSMLFLRQIRGGLWNHPTYTAITGAGVGYFFGSNSSLARRTFALIGSLVAAMVLHGFFDSPLLESDAIVASIVKGLPAWSCSSSCSESQGIANEQRSRT